MLVAESKLRPSFDRKRKSSTSDRWKAFVSTGYCRLSTVCVLSGNHKRLMRWSNWRGGYDSNEDELGTESVHAVLVDKS